MTGAVTGGNQPDFQIGVHENDDLNIDVQGRGAQDIDIQVAQQPDVELEARAGRLIPPDQIVTDFPDSNLDDGNTMKCLEQALLDAGGQGHLRGAERESALLNLKGGVTKVSGHLLKDGTRADSPVIADTYQDPATGKKYYKFLQTWEINVTINGENKTIRKTQWTVTGVEQPTNFSNPKYVRYQHHFALLAVKCHRHIHKAGLNPQHKEYTYVRDCINDVRNNNLLAPNQWGERLAFTTEMLTEHHVDDRSYSLEDTIGYNHSTRSLGITLKNSKGKTTNIYIDTLKQGRKVDETGQKYIKKGMDLENPDQSFMTLGQKLRKQSFGMAIRGNQDIDNYLDVLQAKAEDVENVLESMRFEGVNDRGMTFSEVKDEMLSARKEQAKIHKRNAKFSGMKFQAAISGMKFQAAIMEIYGPKIGDSKAKALKLGLKQMLYSEHKFTKSVLKELQGEALTDSERRRLQEAVNDLKKANNILDDSQRSVNIQGIDAQAEFIAEAQPFPAEYNEMALDDLSEQLLEIDNAPASNIVKENQALLDLADNLLP